MSHARGGSGGPGASFARDLAEARPMAMAALTAHFGDLDAAEEAFAEACLALTQSGAVPDHLAAWLIAVGRRKGVDRLRQNAARMRAHDGAARVAGLEGGDMDNVIERLEPIPDERLRLLFICCHPALAREARAALALRILCGLSVPAIAELFLTSEATMFQRITRAKAKIAGARVSFELPPRRQWPERIEAVLLALELAYTSAYADAGGSRPANQGGAMAGEVERLTSMMAHLLPEEPEALGLAALVALARARERARVGAAGAMVPLSQQDTALWDIRRIERARAWLEKAQAAARPGPYQMMAAIQLAHARRAFDGRVDWAAIATLYEALHALRPGPIVALNRALAVAEASGAETGLRELEALGETGLSGARPYHVARARMLERLERRGQARAALDRALELAPPRAERLYLEAWRGRLDRES